MNIDVAEEFVEKQIASNEYIFSGRLELDYITEKYDLNLVGKKKRKRFQAISSRTMKSIPQQKESIIIGNYEFDILNVSDTRIETVKLKLLK